MIRCYLILLAIMAGVMFSSSASWAGDVIHNGWAGDIIHNDRAARWYNATRSWHGPYAHAAWGRPVALIVPPTVNMQTEYAWGVGRTRMAPINHQFARPYALPMTGATRPAPVWPADTTQIGFYSVRGPW
jgi:hypothetical protein